MINREKQSVASRLLNSVLDFAFPRQCLLCEALDPERNKTPNPVGYCDACCDKLTPVIENSCEHCGAAVGPYVSTVTGCVHCRGRALKFDAVIRLGMYDSALRTAILSAKWSFSSAAIKSLSQLLADARRNELIDYAPDLIIPVPQSWQTRFYRRFNAATLMSFTLGSSLGVAADEHILRRRRNSRPQKRVPVHQRFKNQKDAFRIQDRHMVVGKRILLVDDVMTTGATCSEASRMLKSNGAASCVVAVLARVLDSG